jgi:hypothetical protein
MTILDLKTSTVTQCVNAYTINVASTAAFIDVAIITTGELHA